METILATVYLIAVSILTIGYLFYAVYQWIDRRCSKRASKPETPEPAYNMVGKSHSVFLTPLVIEPIISDKLETEMKSEAVSEPEIQPDDVEVNLGNLQTIDADELDDFSGQNVNPEDVLSQGLTFEQISHAIEVVDGKKSGETDEYLAGQTFSMMPTDFLEVICGQPEHEAKVKKLISGYLDFPDKMKPVRVAISDFDINKYV